jgi:fermentation-respiration switch protein FrsA (DUF1100 family)
MKALLLENVHPDATASLQASRIDVSTSSGGIDERELSEALAGVQLLGLSPDPRRSIEASRAFGVLPTLSPVDVVRSLPDRAFLFLQARGDPLLAVSNADQLFTASSNGASRLDVIAGQDHMDTYTHNSAGYMSVLLSFIDQQLGRGAKA